jgi:serine phosphatase RsbU (regulator of sigma subunit)
MMTEIESQLYGINIPEYTSFLTKQFEEQQEKNRDEKKDDEDDEDDEFEIDDATIAKAEELGIAPILYEQLEGQYKLTSKEIEITQYKLKPNPVGGRTKRKTRKLKGKKKRQTKRNQKQRKKSI